MAALAAAALLCVADRQAALTHAAGVPAACQSAALIFRVTVAALALAAAFTFSQVISRARPRRFSVRGTNPRLEFPDAVAALMGR